MKGSGIIFVPMHWRRALALSGGVALCSTLCCTAPPHQALSSSAPGNVTTTLRASAAGSTPVERDVPAAWTWLGFNRLRGDAYPLDDVARRLEPKTRVQCDPKALTAYNGTSVAYAGQVLVDPAFVERLKRFEEVVVEVSQEVYGRAPAKLIHAGAYSCRTSRNRTTRISEHALGNALDVVGFSFNGVSKAQREATPALARGYFRVSVSQHWNAERSEVGRLHRHFLRTLADRVVDAGVFRVALGPSHPGHSDHLHFDMSPWTYTNL